MEPIDLEKASKAELLAYYNVHSGAEPIKSVKNREFAMARVMALIKDREKQLIINVGPPEDAPLQDSKTEPLKPAEPTPIDVALSDLKDNLAKKTKKELSAEAAQLKTNAKAEKQRLETERKARLKQQKVDDVAARKVREQAKKEESGLKRGQKSFRREPVEEKIRAVRQGTKVGALLDMISRKPSEGNPHGGATIAEMESMTIDGKPMLSPSANIRNLLNYDIGSVLGYGFYSEDGERVHILYPAGMKAVLPHIPPQSKIEVTRPDVPKPPKALKKAKGAPAVAPAPAAETLAPSAVANTDPHADLPPTKE